MKNTGFSFPAGNTCPFMKREDNTRLLFYFCGEFAKFDFVKLSFAYSETVNLEIHVSIGGTS